jgi:hypothetical protein
MKNISLIAVAVAAMIVGLTPLAASAQGRAAMNAAARAAAERAAQVRAARTSGPGPVTQAQRDQGAAEAPAAAAAARIACNIKEARFISASVNPQTRQNVSLYEVGCAEGLGYILQQSPGGASAFNCLAVVEEAAAAVAQGRANPLTCRLDSNAAPKQGLAPLVASRNCTLTDARSMGTTATGETFFEAACEGGRGYVIRTAAPGAPAPAQVQPCEQYLGAPNACTLTTKAQIVAGLGRLASQGGAACTPSDGRFVGSNASGALYEVACGAGAPGYMLETDLSGALSAALECSKARELAGGCKLTATVVSEVAEAANYTKLARANGYPCDVSKYRSIGIDQATKSEVVELACANRPDGAIAFFPTTAGGKVQRVDCVASAAIAQACSLSQPEANYAKYTASLAAQGKTSCRVSAAKWLAQTRDGLDLIETACADGLPGFVLVIARADGAIAELLTCGQSRASGFACALPTNLASAGR